LLTHKKNHLEPQPSTVHHYHACHIFTRTRASTPIGKSPPASSFLPPCHICSQIQLDPKQRPAASCGCSFATSPGARRRPGRWPRGGRGRQARPAASRGARTSDTLMGDLPGAATSQRVRTADQRCSGPLPIFPGGPHVDHMAVKVVADGCIGVQLRWTSGRAVLVDGARFIDCFYSICV